MEWHAEVNNDLLTKLITMDEGSCYLGECALVPFDSPINRTGLLSPCSWSRISGTAPLPFLP